MWVPRTQRAAAPASAASVFLDAEVNAAVCRLTPPAAPHAADAGSDDDVEGEGVEQEETDLAAPPRFACRDGL
jgi:hypothetical protein